MPDEPAAGPVAWNGDLYRTELWYTESARGGATAATATVTYAGAAGTFTALYLNEYAGLASTGALDQDLRFYLMARGIPEKEAEALLVQAFVGEAIEGIEHAGLRDALLSHVASWLSARK